MNPVSRVMIPVGAGALACEIHLPDKLPSPAVVCCHGLLSSKDSTKYLAIAEELRAVGIAAVRFDFSGAGECTAPLGPNLLESWLRDLDAVLGYVRARTWMAGPLGLLGSSMGGYVSLLMRDSGRHPVNALVCWSTPFRLERIRAALEDGDELAHVFPAGFKLGHPQTLASLGPIPGALVIHGQEDDLVHWGQATDIYRRLGEPRKLVLLRTAEHRILDPEWRRLALRLSIDWFRKRFST